MFSLPLAPLLSSSVANGVDTKKKMSSLEDLVAEPFLETEGTHCPSMLGWSTLWGATLLQQTRYANVDRRCCVAHSPRLVCVPCLSLTFLTSSVHLGIPKQGGRWPDASCRIHSKPVRHGQAFPDASGTPSMSTTLILVVCDRMQNSSCAPAFLVMQTSRTSLSRPPGKRCPY